MLALVPAVIAAFLLGFGAVSLIANGEKLAGFGLLLIAIVTGVLAFRRLLARRLATEADEGIGNLSGAAFDHLIWIAIGIPIVFGVLLVVMLMSSNL